MLKISAITITIKITKPVSKKPVKTSPVNSTIKSIPVNGALTTEAKNAVIEIVTIVGM